MSTRSTIALVRISDEYPIEKYLHIFYDVDGVHITIEREAYDYEKDIHISDKQWEEAVEQIEELNKLYSSKLNSV